MSVRVGDWMKVHSGKKFYPLDPLPEEIDINDIAHHLSNICRFNGATKQFYSVAQHSVIVAELMLEAAGEIHYMSGLLHDASEAYIGDITRPMKRSLESVGSYNRIYHADKTLQDAIYKKFLTGEQIKNFNYKLLKWADNKALYTEGRDLMGGTEDWHDANDVKPMSDKIIAWTPDRAKKIFLNLFSDYFG